MDGTRKRITSPKEGPTIITYRYIKRSIEIIAIIGITAMITSTINPITPLQASPEPVIRTVYMDRPVMVMAKEMLDARSYQCFVNITRMESHTNPLAINPASGAEGIAQLLPSTMKSLGLRHTNNPNIQLLGFITYSSRHYGSICGGWAHWKKHHNY